jgi:UDP-glucose:(heptosyl)LPS alpha-1,3-glucosyltransferase
MKRMRIGLVMEWLDVGRGGAETSTSQFMECLLKRDIDVVVFTRSEGDSSDRLEVRTIRPQSRTRAGATISFIQQAESAIRESGCDVIHALTPCEGADIYQPRGGTVAETIRRTIATRRTSLGRGFKAFAMRFNSRQRWLLRKERGWLSGSDSRSDSRLDSRLGLGPPLVIALSDYVVDQLGRHYAVPDERIRRVFNGVSLDRNEWQDGEHSRRAIRGALGVGSEEFVTVQVCYNFRLKGVETHLEALARIRGSGVDAHAMIVGGEGGRRWHKLARRLGVTDNVHWLGARDAVAPYLRAADVMVHPTFYDPCSRVVLEAIALGLPVVGSYFDGSTEVFGSERSDYAVCDPADAEGVAARILRLRESAFLARTHATLEGLRGSVSMERHTDDVVRLYGDVATGRDRKSGAGTKEMARSVG